MTVLSEIDRSGPYSGNGVTTAFDYDFKVLDKSHLRVIREEYGVETALTVDTHYTVSGVGSASGGAVTMLSAPTSGQTITIIRNMPFTQAVDLTNQGALFASQVETALDRAAMRDQQLQEQLDRAVMVPVSRNPPDIDGMVEDILRLADSADAIDALAPISSEIETVAGAAGAVVTVAENIADVTNFSSVYQGPKIEDPVERNDGAALVAGDLYFNTDQSEMRYFNGASWDALVPPADNSVVAAYVNLRRNVFTPSDYGAVGTSNDAAVVTAALNAANAHALANGGAVVEFNRIYQITSGITVSANNGLRIYGTGGSSGLALAGSATFNGLNVVGPGGSAVSSTITSVGVLRDNFTVASTTGFAAGDYVLITNAPTDGGVLGSLISRSFMALVTLVNSGTGEIVIDNPIPFNLQTGWTECKVTKIDLASDVEIQNIKIDGTSHTGGGSGLRAGNLLNPIISDIDTRYMEGDDAFGIMLFQMLGAQIRGLRDFASGDGADSNAIQLQDISASSAFDVAAMRSNGFGVGITRLSDCDIGHVRSFRTAGRGVKLFGSCGNRISEISANACASGFVGVAISGGSCDNQISGISAHGNIGEGLWMNGTDNSRNILNNIRAFNNNGINIRVDAISPYDDVDNVLTDIDPRASSTGGGIHMVGARTQATYSRRSAFRAKPAGTPSIPSGAWTAVTMDTEAYDINGDFDTSTGAFTAPLPGLYLFSLAVSFTSGFTGASGYVGVHINGSLSDPYIIDAIDSTTRQMTFSVRLNKGDTVKPAVYQASGSSRTVNNAGYATRFEGVML